MKLWDATNGELLKTLTGHAAWLESVAFVGGGELLVSSGSDQMLKVWNVETGEEQVSVKAHDGRVFAVAVSSDGTRIASASDDGTVKLWRLRGKRDVDED